jgi:hypothetical protein
MCKAVASIKALGDGETAVAAKRATKGCVALQLPTSNTICTLATSGWDVVGPGQA